MISCKAGTQYVEASAELDRSAPYHCPECEQPVILKAGEIKIAHFAHKVDAGCSNGSGETEWHLMAKSWTAKFLRRGGWSVQIEHRLEDQTGSIKRRADVFAVNREGFKTVIEFQKADEGGAIIERTSDLARFCDEIVWVLPFNADRIDGMYRRTMTTAIKIFTDADIKPAKSELMFFPNPMQGVGGLYVCRVHPWYLDERDPSWRGGHKKESARWCQLEITSISGGGKYGFHL
jgi:hypothetical protein